jgi:hypothetical protein
MLQKRSLPFLTLSPLFLYFFPFIQSLLVTVEAPVVVTVQAPVVVTVEAPVVVSVILTGKRQKRVFVPICRSLTLGACNQTFAFKLCERLEH